MGIKRYGLGKYLYQRGAGFLSAFEHVTDLVGNVESIAWPLAVPLVISQRKCSEVNLVGVTLTEGGLKGRGECCPSSLYDETPETEISKIQQVLSQLSTAQALDDLVQEMTSGAARNALDCALWDLRAKQQGRRVWELLGQADPDPVTNVYTISFGHPDMMAAAAMSAIDRGCHHIKLEGGGAGDDQRVRAVRAVAPDAIIIIDAHEAWEARQLSEHLKVMAGEGVALVEQPLPAGRDNALSAVEHLVPICADESYLTIDDIPRVAKLYDFINIKLDKTGGLTAALAQADAAKRHGLKTMVGCMLGTSLAMAPAMLLADQAEYIDLGGQLLLEGDYEPSLRIEGSMIYPPEAELWG